MKKRLLILLLIVSVAINLGIFAKVLFNSSPPKEMCDIGCIGSGWQESPICLKLNLSKQQIKHMEELRKDYQKQISPLTGQLKAKRNELFLLLKSESLPTEAVDKILKEIASIQAAIQKQFVHFFFRTRNTFTPEQQEKFYFYVQQCLYDNNGDTSCHQHSPGGTNHSNETGNN